MGSDGRTIFSDLTTGHSLPRRDSASTMAAATNWATQIAIAWLGVAAVSTEYWEFLNTLCGCENVTAEHAMHKIRIRFLSNRLLR